MQAILIHGMGRTPASMLVLALRLRAAGLQPHLFGYIPALESWQNCVTRLEKFINQRVAQQDYIIIGHSLGTVLTRGVLVKLKQPPRACFFLAPPTKACWAAKKFSPLLAYKLLMGEMGQLLANSDFMDSLPIPNIPCKIYSGTKGLKGRYSPFGDQENDGVLTVSETLLPNVPTETVATMHTFIMNKKMVAEDIINLINISYE